MKNIFIILGLLVVGMVFIGCPNPNVGGDDYIIENGGNNGSENGNGGENNGGNEIVLSNETITQFTFKIVNSNGTFDAERTTLSSNSPKYQVRHSSFFVQFDIQNNTIEIKNHSNNNCNFTIDYESKIITFDFTNPN